jgi:Peptidase family M28
MIAERYTDYMYNLIDSVVKEIGPRLACSEEEKKLGRLFADEIRPTCERVDTETFTCSPTAFMGFFPYLTLMYLAGVVCYFFLPAVSMVLALVVATIFILEVVRYKEFIDPIYPKKQGENVSGIVKPTGDVKRRVIVSAHFDSAYEFNIWHWFKSFSVVIMVIGFLSVVLLFGFGLARTVVEPVGTPDAMIFLVFGIILAALSPVFAIIAFWHTKDVTPGAMDNMSGISVVTGLAKYLKDASERGEFYPRNTEVVLLGCSSEEAGLRGAKRYASRHLEEFSAIPTYGIFLDCLYDEDYFTVFKREMYMGVGLDQGLVELTLKAAGENDFKIKTGVIPFGATDGSAFAQAGINTVSMFMLDMSRMPPNYHTRHDTIDYIKPRCLAVALQTVMDMVRLLDQ